MASTTTWQRSGARAPASRPAGSRPGAPDAPPGARPGRPDIRSDGEPDDWLADEPAVLQVIVAELQRFKVRMKVHPVPILLLALLMSAGAVFMFARKPTLYTARVILRISEGALSQYRGALLPQIELKDYIYNYALSDRALMEEIIDEHHVFQRELRLFGADGAVEALREGLSIEAYHNFFHYNQFHESTPRSLRLGIVYKHQDADLAYKLAVLLSDLVVAVESNKRLQEVQFAAANAHEVLAAAEAAQAEREEQISTSMTALADAELTGDGVGAAMARVQIASLAQVQRREAQNLENLRSEVERIDLSLKAEEGKMGLVFELAGRVRPVQQPPPGPLMLGLVGLVCFCIFVPVCAIGLGTLDSRIHELGDVRRLGMPALGHIPAFPGDRVGSLRRRGALAPRGLLGRLGWGHRRVRRVAARNRVAS
jgi:hypothetical protein